MESVKRVKAPGRKSGGGSKEDAARRPGRMSAGIDPDERIWRPLGEARGGVSPWTHARMQALAYELWLTNLMGQRLIEIVTDHVVGEGVSWHGEDERALSAVKAFWGDPVNQMDIRFERLVSELGIFGELLLPAAVSRFEGRVRLGYVSPRLIEEVVTDPDNCALPIGVVLRAEGPGGAARKGKRVRTVLGGDPRGYLSASAQKERARFTDGEAFLFQINKASDAARGASDLLAAIDWIDTYERFIFDAVERARLQNSFIYDVTLKGAGPEKIAEWLAENGVAPKPSSVRVHNEKEEWQAVSPDSQRRRVRRAGHRQDDAGPAARRRGRSLPLVRPGRGREPRVGGIDGSADAQEDDAPPAHRAPYPASHGRQAARRSPPRGRAARGGAALGRIARSAGHLRARHG